MASPACSLLYDAGAFSASVDGAAPLADGPTEASDGSSIAIVDASSAPRQEADAFGALDRSLYPPDATYWDDPTRGNGHGYFVVRAPSRVPWAIARDAALRVPRGHLATLETFEEYEVVKAAVLVGLKDFVVRGLERIGPWIGLERVAPGYTKLGWVNGSAYRHDARMWASGEPNDDPPGEPFVGFFGFTTSSDIALNDAADSDDVRSYVVEVE